MPSLMSPVRFSTLVPVSLMLFSMFFGAGNLIFPPLLGAQAGTNFSAAITGFLLSAVLLPVLTVIALAISGRDVRSVASRGGKVFAVSFSVVTYLAIGAFFGIPRTGAVSFSTAVAPVTGQTGLGASVVFNMAFFAVAFFLALRPTGLTNHLGKVLTPMLLLLLTALVLVVLFTLDATEIAPTEKYTDTPLAAGLMEGYLTMDSIAALAFGIVVISAFGGTGTPRPLVVRSTILAAICAGGLLAAVYFGLAMMGHRIDNGQSFSDGAQLLATVSKDSLGSAGQLVFGGIVLLACLTTAVGLLAASSEFFHSLVPGISYRVWLTIFVLISFIIASLGLDAVFAVAVPVITVIYPIAISVVTLTLLDSLVPSIELQRGFSIPVWLVTGYCVLSLVLPTLAAAQFGWLLPLVLGCIVGCAIDYFLGKERSVIHVDKEGSAITS